MSKKLEVYKCHKCGQIVQVLVDGVGELVCCDEPMEHLVPNNSISEEVLTEKHSPKEIICNDLKKYVIENHPMTDEHYIMFMEEINEDKSKLSVKFFKPGDKCMMLSNYQTSKACAYCNIHGLFKSEEK